MSFTSETLSQFVDVGNKFGYHSSQAHEFVVRHSSDQEFLELALETYKNLHETSRLELVK